MAVKRKSVAACVVAAGIGLVAFQTLVYNGFCVAKGGWPDESELYDTALHAVYDAYPPQRFRIPGVFSKQITNHIHYRDFEDFVARNPNCCSLSDTGWKGLKVGFLNKMRGYSGGFVRVEYAADADEISPEGRAQIAKTTNFFDSRGEKYAPNRGNLSFVPMTNCGKIWQGY